MVLKLKERVDGSAGKPAAVLTHLHVDIAILAPAMTPGVLHNPEGLERRILYS